MLFKRRNILEGVFLLFLIFKANYQLFFLQTISEKSFDANVILFQ